MNNIQYFEDLVVGQRFGSRRITIEEEDIKRFAREFDPQPFHVDERQAEASFFRGLAASGMHTAALTMRLLVDSEFKPAGGIVGAGIEALRWPCPMRPGDELSIEAEILDVRPSKSRTQQGIVKARVTTLNQKREVLQEYVAILMVQRCAA